MKAVLIVGGNGTVGRAMVERFTETWEVTSVDIEANPHAQVNILFKSDESFELQAQSFLDQTRTAFSSIICVAGGFESGQISDPSVFSQADRMLKTNLFPALFTAHIATRRLKEGGVLILTGAATPFKAAAPGIIGYALAKTAIHSLSLNLATGVGLPSSVCVLTILPETIDTLANKVSTPEADTSLWLDPGKIADLVRMWCEGRDRPPNGSFLLLRKAGDRLNFEFV